MPDRPTRVVKSKKLITPNAGEGAGNRLSFIADGNAKWYSHLEDSLAGFYKAEHGLSVRFSSEVFIQLS